MNASDQGKTFAYVRKKLSRAVFLWYTSQVVLDCRKYLMIADEKKEELSRFLHVINVAYLNFNCWCNNPMRKENTINRVLNN
jgi:hypothetical protein